MAYRVIQWGTGNVGLFSLRAILDRPDLDLAGVWVHDAAKVGQDVGTLCGRAPVGIAATNDAESLLAMGADCVCYAATTDLRPLEGVQEICGILASGCNVVSSSPVAFVHPKSCPVEVHDQLVGAACRGGASLFISGIDPGFLDDVLPLTLTALCGRWRELRVIEILNYATYDRHEALFDAMGFGQPMNQTPMLLTPGVLEFTWGGALHLLAEGLGLTLDGVDSSYEKRPAERPLRIGTCTVEAGTLAALRFEIRGIVAGRAPLVIEHVTRLDDDLAPDWPSGSGGYRVLLTGEPTIRCEVEFEDAHGDHTVGAVLATATRIVNAIPNVCRSAPGFLSALDLPAVTGGGLYRG
jgi:4-hydroxy-tetrahydrodipicolinate reductase